MNVPPTCRALYDEIVAAPTRQRERIVRAVAELAAQTSLAWALRALFRQQVRSGYVLFDPAAAHEERVFTDPELGVSLRLQWNPHRRLRKQHALLLARGVLAADVDPARLINRNAKGQACYLCEANIALQNPGEIAWPLQLAGETYVFGANFVPITANHFTVMSREHRVQRYHRGLLKAGVELLERSGGEFRVLFNGRAGASIEEHEHLHATDETFPVESLDLASAPPLWQGNGVQLLAPAYYVPLYVIEGDEPGVVVDAADRLLLGWREQDPLRHTENLLLTRVGGRYRVFVFPRDRARLGGPGRSDALGSFEMSGRLVLADEADRALFEQADLATLRALLSAATPERAPRPLG